MELNRTEEEEILDWIRESNIGMLRANIPATKDGHIQDEAGMTPLHWAVKLGKVNVVKCLLWQCQVHPHVLTLAGDTPADLTTSQQLTQLLHSHTCPQVSYK